MKYLVFGAVQEDHWQQWAIKAADLNAKHGPFDACFCINASVSGMNFTQLTQC